MFVMELLQFNLYVNFPVAHALEINLLSLLTFLQFIFTSNERYDLNFYFLSNVTNVKIKTLTPTNCCKFSAVESKSFRL